MNNTFRFWLILICLILGFIGVSKAQTTTGTPSEQHVDSTAAKPLSTFFTLNAAYSSLPQWSYGFKVGQVKFVGWYVSLMTNFHFRGMYHPFEDDEIYQLTGNNKTIRFSGQVGFVLRPCKPMSILLGVGYGYRTCACQSVDNEWYCYPKRTFHGVDASLGLLFDIKKLALSAEVVTTNFKTVEARVGLGFCLPTNKSQE